MGEPTFKEQSLEIANDFIDAVVNPAIAAARDGTEQELNTPVEMLESIQERLVELQETMGVEVTVSNIHADLRDGLQRFSQELRAAAMEGDIDRVEKLITEAEEALESYIDGELEELNVNISYSQSGDVDQDTERARLEQLTADMEDIRTDIAKATPVLDDGTTREDIEAGFDTAHDEIHKLQREISEYKLQQQEADRGVQQEAEPAVAPNISS